MVEVSGSSGLSGSSAPSDPSGPSTAVLLDLYGSAEIKDLGVSSGNRCSPR